MHTITRQHGGARSPIRSGRVRMVATAAVLVIGVVLFIWLVTDTGSGSKPQASPSSVSLQSGPNETERGIAAASAASGIVPVPGGPDETARGAAAASATRGLPSGGPNEDARGNAAASATRPLPSGGPNEDARGAAARSASP